ncbi:PA0069 family radical SAM protein [Microvirga tunisiensis]|uniref:PA0069 family radical SAM protein n=1 Tax=Pannonibacter tanglangensis TaxID=2750084 RepID=A0A7X5F360_9HYPH|nr:PA0069 family radical SAM protein [Pannonibacter sp. XCT-53]NBN78920.1 PA0069 family radical SAM protein [Pannonibacter sp. XCT-53]
MAAITLIDQVSSDTALAGARVAEDLRRGRGAGLNRSGRFEREQREAFDDGWETLDDLPPLKTTVQEEKARSIITRNTSPDISFDRSINPYRGCEHGCVYCFARPSHAFMGLSPGLDFETRLFAKPNAAELLERELGRPGYQPRTIAIGTNTDPYQPIERRYRLMREILEVLERTGHPVGIVTKSALVLRDVDILARMAEKGLAKVALSITSLDRDIARTLEPRASAPHRRLAAIKGLSEAGVPVSVMMAPIIPALTDSEIEAILEAAAGNGATEAGYVLLRLPLEVSELFRDWLLRNRPDRYRHVMNILRSMRGGKDYDAEWGQRMKGQGPYAQQIGQRFALTARRLGLNQRRRKLTTELFTAPQTGGVQLSLF